MQLTMASDVRLAATKCTVGALLWFASAPLAWSQSVNPPPVPAADQSAPMHASVRVDGRHIIDVTGGGVETAAQRAERINRRLQSLLDDARPLPAFGVRDISTRGGETYLSFGGYQILTVTEADAADALMTRQALAQTLGEKLYRALSDAKASRASPVKGIGILLRDSFGDLTVSFLKWLPRLVGAFVVWLAFFVLARLGRWTVRQVGERMALDANLRQLVRASVYYGIWAVGVVAILATLGLAGSSIAAGLGMSGFILGFAFKDILSHFFAGLMLLVGRQFNIGDQIVVKDFEGTVERIELRALHLRTYDNRLVMIPNGDVLTSAVVSNTASPHRRREFLVGIGYADDIGKAQEVALGTIVATPGVLEDPPPDVLVEELGASSIGLRVRFYTSSLRADHLKVGSEVVKRVKEAFDRDGITIPAPQQTVIIGNVEDIARAVARTVEGKPDYAGTGT